jgi:hypothetical protein
MAKNLLLSGAAGVAFGALVLGSQPASGQDFGAVVAAITALQSALSGILNTGFKSVSDLLTQGFTQNANYSKAQIGAHQQIADASNTAMARFHRDMRNRQIVDEHTPNPVHCAALDNGQAVVVAATQAYKVQQAMETVSDPRGEAMPNQPAFLGSGQASQAINALHLSRYCADAEAQAGLCTLSQNPNADQRASSLFSTGSYSGQDGITAANDYMTNLLQPLVPAALRGDQLTSIVGQEASIRRREYNARMSLAHNIGDYLIAAQTPSVPLTAQQQAQAQAEGLPPAQTGSLLQALQLDVDRRYSDVNYAGQLQSMPPASVEREIALELAATNYLLMHEFKLGAMTAMASATSLAAQAEHEFKPAVEMPSPSMN